MIEVDIMDTRDCKNVSLTVNEPWHDLTHPNSPPRYHRYRTRGAQPSKHTLRNPAAWHRYLRPQQCLWIVHGKGLIQLLERKSTLPSRTDVVRSYRTNPALDARCCRCLDPDLSCLSLPMLKPFTCPRIPTSCLSRSTRYRRLRLEYQRDSPKLHENL